MRILRTTVIFCFALVLCALPVSNAKAEMDPRMKALGSMALYGTVGGALLGTASLAFGTSGRSVAIGASLGLYAGLIFGSYVVISHAMRKNRQMNPQPQENYYPDTTSPYEENHGEDYPPDEAFNRSWDLFEEGQLASLGVTASLDQQIANDFKENKIYYLELVRYQF
ncbi:MAG: hypothetical protein Fur0010_21480 [Bdellovibrio sp.]